jgi:hypothetical protein
LIYQLQNVVLPPDKQAKVDVLKRQISRFQTLQWYFTMAAVVIGVGTVIMGLIIARSHDYADPLPPIFEQLCYAILPGIVLAIIIAIGVFGLCRKEFRADVAQIVREDNQPCSLMSDKFRGYANDAEDLYQRALAQTRPGGPGRQALHLTRYDVYMALLRQDKSTAGESTAYDMALLSLRQAANAVFQATNRRDLVNS